MEYLLLLKFNHFYLLLLLIIGSIYFGVTYYKVWVKNNKGMYLLLIISSLMVGGNYLPIWWEEGAKYYDFINNLGFSLLSAFIFYWLTVGKEEIKKRQYYSFYSLKFIYAYHKIFVYFYLRNKFKIEREKIKTDYKEGKAKIEVINLRIDLPYSKIFEILKNINELTDEILKILKEEAEKNEKAKIKYVSEELKKIHSSIDDKQNEKMKKEIKVIANSLFNKNNMYIYRIYLEICEEYKEFMKELNYYSNLANYEELDDLKFLLNYSRQNLNGKYEELKYFIINQKYVEKRFLKIINNNFNLLKLNKRHIPAITVNLTSTNFGILNSKMIYILVSQLYEGMALYYFDYVEEKEYEIISIEEEKNEYKIKFVKGEKNLNKIKDISIEKKKVVLS